VPKFSSARFRRKFNSPKTLGFTRFFTVPAVGIPQAKRDLSDNFNHQPKGK
jgi:hypothetical protein